MYKASDNREIRLKKDEKSHELMARLFIRFYGHETSGIRKCDITAKALSEWLGSLGYDIKASAIRGAGRLKLVQSVVPVTASTLAFARQLIDKFPSFDPSLMFAAEPDDVRQQLN
ncbi:hypothetical protein [Photobacterium leiognathi]|uniref:hypothetical protein n=1 Tax=Photobacterium leiognathi TaxID=553611 RepID=UPI00273941AA|nr:hypothetical protein [Photobacterium leiognathi]